MNIVAKLHTNRGSKEVTIDCTFEIKTYPGIQQHNLFSNLIIARFLILFHLFWKNRGQFVIIGRMLSGHVIYYYYLWKMIFAF